MEKLKDEDFNLVLQNLTIALEKAGLSCDFEPKEKASVAEQYKFYLKIMEALTPLVIHYSASSQCDKCYNIIGFDETYCEVNGFGIPIFLCEKCFKKFKK